MAIYHSETTITLLSPICTLLVHTPSKPSCENKQTCVSKMMQIELSERERGSESGYGVRRGPFSAQQSNMLISIRPQPHHARQLIRMQRTLMERDGKKAVMVERERKREQFFKRKVRESVTGFNPVTCTEHAVSGWLLMTTGERA